MNILRHKLWHRTAVCLLGVVLLFVTIAVGVLARSDDGYNLGWWTVDSGGYTRSEGGDYTLAGTLGQPDAGGVLSGDEYRLFGGFWSGFVEKYGIYLPLILRGN